MFKSDLSFYREPALPSTPVDDLAAYLTTWPLRYFRWKFSIVQKTQNITVITSGDLNLAGFTVYQDTLFKRHS